jgi:hypothetical protein
VAPGEISFRHLRCVGLHESISFRVPAKEDVVMSQAKKTSVREPQPLEAQPRPDADRASILERVNARYENSLRYLGC